MMAVMPFALPVYFFVWRWWEVEPKLARAAFFGFWAIYYGPKALIAVVLIGKDIARFVIWLFEWFQRQLGVEPEPLAVAAAPSATLDLSDMKHMPRRDFLREIGWTAATVPFVVVGYGVFRQLYDFEVHRVEVPIAGLPRALDGLTIAQLSDLHAGSFFSTRPMAEAAETVNALHPDLITITGDFVNHDVEELPLILPALRTLKAELGVYGCLGNHDHYASIEGVKTSVRATPVDLLVNEHRTLSIGGARLHIVGTDNTGFNQHFADLPGALSGIERDPNGEDATILLAHDPTFWDLHVRPTAPQVDLMLSGHTHGGQIGFEAGPLRWSLARVMYERWAGLYTEPRAEGRGAQQLYVNRGLGTVGPPLRLGIRPEITLLTLRRKA
jgi:predicted MPP superfamily phosphohydrolase